MPRSFPHFNPQAGLSLLEMSVVLAIVALVTVGTFSMGSSIIESVRKVNTNNKLDAIETALMAFRLANNRLPCPSDATQTDTPANANTYGDEADNASGTCSGGSPSANFSYTLPSSTASAAVGNINGDGYADLLIGAYGSSNGYAGAADVVFGHAPPWPAVMDLGTLNGGNGFHLSSVTGGDQTGFSVAVGDVNGDGFADMIIGSGCGWNNSNAGNTYVVFGGPGPETAPGLWQPRWPAFLSLGTLDGSNGTVLAGATPGDCVGFYVAAGDLMGDGYVAIVTGAPWANYNGEAQSGSTYVYFGKRSGWSASYDLGGL